MFIFLYFFFLRIRRPPRSTRTDTLFPTRRSSDLQSIEDVMAYCRLPTVSAHGTAIEETAGYTVALLRSEEHTSELQSLMRISYAVFCLKKKKKNIRIKSKLANTLHKQSKLMQPPTK